VLDLYLPIPQTSALRFRSMRCRTAPWREWGSFEGPVDWVFIAESGCLHVTLLP